jgi:hypothetical protein
MFQRTIDGAFTADLTSSPDDCQIQAGCRNFYGRRQRHHWNSFAAKHAFLLLRIATAHVDRVPEDLGAVAQQKQF